MQNPLQTLSYIVLALVLSIMPAWAWAENDRVQQELTDPAPIIPPLRKALGDTAYEKAMSSGEYSYIGNLKCRLCHRDFFIGRKQDVHEYAYRNLLTERHNDNPRCLTCHTTGYGTPTGFTTMEKTAKLANVQCEGCHGPGNKHMQRNAAGGFLAGSDNPAVLEKMCLACHTERWNKSFTDLHGAYVPYKSAKPSLQ